MEMRNDCGDEYLGIIRGGREGNWLFVFDFAERCKLNSPSRFHGPSPTVFIAFLQISSLYSSTTIRESAMSSIFTKLISCLVVSMNAGCQRIHGPNTFFHLREASRRVDSFFTASNVSSMPATRGRKGLRPTCGRALRRHAWVLYRDLV